LNEDLGNLDLSKRSVAEVQLKVFAKSIMSTEIFGGNDKATPPCNDSCLVHTSGELNFQKCTDKDVRNLRNKKGTSSLGDKTIMKCRKCVVVHIPVKTLQLQICARCLEKKNLLRRK
jgi:hypothetical protein